MNYIFTSKMEFDFLRTLVILPDNTTRVIYNFPKRKYYKTIHKLIFFNKNKEIGVLEISKTIKRQIEYHIGSGNTNDIFSNKITIF